VPDFSTVSRRRKQLREVLVDRTDPLGLHLIVDDGGIQIMRMGDWELMHRTSSSPTQWAKVTVQLIERSRSPVPSIKGAVGLATP